MFTKEFLVLLKPPPPPTDQTLENSGKVFNSVHHCHHRRLKSSPPESIPPPSPSAPPKRSPSSTFQTSSPSPSQRCDKGGVLPQEEPVGFSTPLEYHRCVLSNPFSFCCKRRFQTDDISQVSRANGFNIGTGAYTLLIPL